MPHRQRPRPLATGSLLAAASALAVAACGGSSHKAATTHTTAPPASQASNGVAAQTPAQILHSTERAFASARTVHVTGQVIDQGRTVGLNLEVVSGQGSSGVATVSGSQLDLVIVPSSLYMRAPAQFWKLAGAPAPLTLLAANRWRKLAATGSLAKQLQPFESPAALIAKAGGAHGVLTKGTPTTVNGVPVIPVFQSGNHSTLYVATTGPPYPIEAIENTSARREQVYFSGYGEPATVTVPKGAIDLSALGQIGA